MLLNGPIFAPPPTRRESRPAKVDIARPPVERFNGRACSASVGGRPRWSPQLAAGLRERSRAENRAAPRSQSTAERPTSTAVDVQQKWPCAAAARPGGANELRVERPEAWGSRARPVRTAQARDPATRPHRRDAQDQWDQCAHSRARAPSQAEQTARDAIAFPSRAGRPGRCPGDAAAAGAEGGAATPTAYRAALVGEGRAASAELRAC